MKSFSSFPLFRICIVFLLFLFWSFPFIVNASESEQEKSATVSFTIHRPIEAPQVIEVIPLEQENFFQIKVLSRPNVQLQLSGLPNGEEKQYQTNSEGVAWIEVEANDSLKKVELVAYDDDDGKSPVVQIPLSFNEANSVDKFVDVGATAVSEAMQPRTPVSSFRSVQFLGLVLIVLIVVYFVISPQKSTGGHRSTRHLHHKSRR